MISFEHTGLSDSFLLELYSSLLKPRLVEEKMLVLIRQGNISKWFSGIGQEAVSVGAVSALKPNEYILPLHRNLGIFTGRDVPLQQLFAQFQGKKSGFTKGRDRSFHFGSKAHHIVGMISHLGAMLPVADGIALADKLSKNNHVCLAFIGEGGTSEGDFHEALNLAAVWKLPVIFLVENNGYSISTPVSEQFVFASFTDKAAGYGIEAKKIDGNNVLEVYKTIKEVAENMRSSPRPVLIEALTFRMRGHEEASPTKFVPEELFEKWAQKDPVLNYENFLMDLGLLTDKEKQKISNKIKKEIDRAWEAMEAETSVPFRIDEEIQDLYQQSVTEISNAFSNKRKLRYVDAIKNGLDECMNKHSNLVLMGQDIAEYGGVFKATEGLAKKYGKERVRNTPICESALVGAALGLSIKGYKSVVEMQFADFVSCGFNQIVNNLAKSHYRWGQNADVVIRMPTGAGTGAGPFHSQSTEAWFFHVPGLKIVYPSSPTSAKGLLTAAIEDPNPVLFFEHKALYRSLSEEVPEGYYALPIGKAKVLNVGNAISLITYGAAVHWATACIQKNKLQNEVEIIDLQSLLPIDYETLSESVKKTGKVLLLTEDTHTGSIMAEISAWLNEHLFEHLDAPIKRVSSQDLPVPFNEELENMFLPKALILEKIQALLAY
jgi:2-oxoisovalerate dehydrogenase E1 component